MDTPSLIFYEHSLDDSQVRSLSKSVLNLGNECRALAEENARLKAEVERQSHHINYLTIEANTDHARWLRCLEDLEKLRNLK